MKPQNEELGGSFIFRVWVTRGCYFVLSDRLRRKARYSVGSVTILSFYVIVISIMQLFYPPGLPPAYREAIPAITLILSVFIIIVTLLETSKEYRLEAEHSLQTAQKLVALFGRCEIHEAGLSKDDQAELHKEYADIMICARTTRRTIDYLWFQFDNPQAFNAKLGRQFVLLLGLVWNGILEYWIYAAMIVVPPLAASLLLF